MDLIFGTQLNLALQNIHSLTIPMQLFSLLGTTEIYLFLITLIYWCYDRKLGVRLAILTALSGWVNDILKLSMQLPRPCWIDSRVQMLNLKPELSFGFPSGHAQMTLPFYGMICYWLKSWKIRISLIALIFIIGISRLYLGVHFPMDVLGGWLFGLVLLVAIICLDKPISSRIAQSSDLALTIFGLVLSVALVTTTSLISAMHSNFSIPSIWSDIDPSVIPNSILFSMKNGLMSSGFIFGIISGGAYARKLSFITSGRLIVRCRRFLVGSTGVVLILIISGILSHVLSGQSGDFLTWLEGAGLGIWILYAAPWMFIRIGLNDV
jgi:membrane-associated phospholipid phosphatase